MLAIIQARTSSKRFNNKILYPIYGTPLIGHVVEKLRKSKKIKQIIVATSNHKTDNKLVKYLKNEKIKFFRGDLNNVARRLYKLAQSKKAKYFVRISGDSPLIDYKLVDEALEILYKNKKEYDLVTNVFPRTFPRGQSVEIIKTAILGKNLKKFSKLEQEHVTVYFYKNYKNYFIKNFTFKSKTKIMKLSIDTKKDLVKILNKFDEKKIKNFLLKKWK